MDTAFRNERIFCKDTIEPVAERPTFDTQVVETFSAIVADTAIMVGCFRNDPVSRLETGDTFANFFDDTGKLMADDNRR